MIFSEIVILLFLCVFCTLFLTILGIGCSYLMQKKALQKSKWSKTYKERAIELYMFPGANLIVVIYAVTALIVGSSMVIILKNRDYEAVSLIFVQAIVAYFCIRWCKKIMKLHTDTLKNI